jgi:hypothetical protein
MASWGKDASSIEPGMYNPEPSIWLLSTVAKCQDLSAFHRCIQAQFMQLTAVQHFTVVTAFHLLKNMR